MPITVRKVMEFDSLPPLEAISKAWNEPGPNRKIHIHIQQRIIEMTPNLAMSISDLSVTGILRAWNRLEEETQDHITNIMPGLGIGIENLDLEKALEANEKEEK